jgi:hypothetical protein
VLRRRSWRRFVTLEGATASIVAGYALERSVVGVALNLIFLAAFALAWWWAGRRSAEG